MLEAPTPPNSEGRQPVRGTLKSHPLPPAGPPRVGGVGVGAEPRARWDVEPDGVGCAGDSTGLERWLVHRWRWNGSTGPKFRRIRRDCPRSLRRNRPAPNRKAQATRRTGPRRTSAFACRASPSPNPTEGRLYITVTM